MGALTLTDHGKVNWDTWLNLSASSVLTTQSLFAAITRVAPLHRSGFRTHKNSAQCHPRFVDVLTGDGKESDLKKELTNLSKTLIEHEAASYLADELSLEAAGHHEVVLQGHGADLNPRQRFSPLHILHSTQQ
ncbi:hypothetical protein U9M48_007559, partial [Paspalum notatum var. saurae]